jgi:hypothetical protein
MVRLLTLASGFFFLMMLHSSSSPAPTDNGPAYTKDGNLVAPANYREWIYLTSGIDMSYTAQPAGAPPPAQSNFDNVFVNPESYRAFLATGTWPDKTTMVLEVRSAENPVSINKRGHTQSPEIMGQEFHVKDHGTWSFYNLDANSGAATLIPRPAGCYTCHEAHGAVDTTFVQFYPTLLPLAQQKHTLSEEYLKETSSPAKP